MHTSLDATQIALAAAHVHETPSAAALPCHPRWPAVAEMLAARGTRSASAWLKTGWRQWLGQRHRQALLQALGQCPAWARRFASDARYFHCADSHFVDRRHGPRQRIAAMAHDLNHAAQVFGPATVERMAAGEQIPLCQLGPDIHLCLGMNDVSYHEGLWALSLRDDTGQRLYYLSLSFLADGSLLVPTLQGPSGSCDDAKTLVRQLTKQAEGLRPPALLMAALRSAAQAWGVSALRGIDPQHHIKGRWNLRQSRLRYDYAGLWQEQGGQLAADGHWQLPCTLPARDLADVPSNKRAMYRRRQALLDGLDRSLRAHWRGA